MIIVLNWHFLWGPYILIGIRVTVFVSGSSMSRLRRIVLPFIGSNIGMNVMVTLLVRINAGSIVLRVQMWLSISVGRCVGRWSGPHIPWRGRRFVIATTNVVTCIVIMAGKFGIKIFSRFFPRTGVRYFYWWVEGTKTWFVIWLPMTWVIITTLYHCTRIIIVWYTFGTFGGATWYSNADWNRIIRSWLIPTKVSLIQCSWKALSYKCTTCSTVTDNLEDNLGKLEKKAKDRRTVCCWCRKRYVFCVLSKFC